MAEAYDIAFLGGGPAGYQGAVRAAQLGARRRRWWRKVSGRRLPELGLHSHQNGAGLRRSGPGHAPGQGIWLSARGGNSRHRPSSPAKSGWFPALRASIGRLFQAHRIALVEGKAG